MIILVYKGILIVAFVEMASTYDRGGDNLNDQGFDLQLIFILLFRDSQRGHEVGGSLLVLVVQ